MLHDLGLHDPNTIPDGEHNSCVFIDGHALIQSPGKPAACKTFGDYTKIFEGCTGKYFTASVKRIDVVFDRYIGQTSIKNATRLKRLGKKRPIRK